MNEIEARADRARQYRDEFLAPVFDEVLAGYTARIIEIASTETNPETRSGKITALSTAIKVIKSIDLHIDSVIEAGKMEERNRLRANEIEKLGPHRKRLLDMVPHR